MFRHNIHKRLGAAAVAAAVLFAVGTPAIADAVYPGVPEWYAQAKVHFDNTRNYMQAMIDAINAKDVAATRSACSSAHDELAINLQAHLPTPDPALTTALQSEIDDVHAAMHICMSLGPNSTSADLANADSVMQQATLHMKTVDAILATDLS
ncbi:hypothetical protein [Mycobacterium sp. 4858]|uniref:hypothetical protein n=1 Tax=Mycobacterium sp. 4858 TaxID=2057185 RepID=UPI000C8533A2|nr:hypothetical protein [Mycobacterium sp. 4858]